MQQWQMLLTVTNPSRLEKGSLPKSQFDCNGGTIGSHKNSHWRLLNYANSIMDTHCEIVLARNQFCLIDRSGKTFVNSAHQPLGKNIAIALQSGDNFTIGDYKIRAEVSMDNLSADIESSLDNLLDINSEQLLGYSADTRHFTLEHTVVDNTVLLNKPGFYATDPLLAFENKEIVDEQLGELIPLNNLGRSKKEVSGSDQSSTSIESISLAPRIVLPITRRKL